MHVHSNYSSCMRIVEEKKEVSQTIGVPCCTDISQHLRMAIRNSNKGSC